MAAGKSTVARLLASRFEHGVCLEGDLFRRSIVRGREDMTPDASPEALRQLRLRYGLAAAAADEYFDAGFTVAVEDVATYAVMVKVGEEILVGNGRRFRVVDVVPFEEEDESPFVGLLQVEAA
jgi:cytidylate kinase